MPYFTFLGDKWHIISPNLTVNNLKSSIESKLFVLKAIPDSITQSMSELKFAWINDHYPTNYNNQKA
jgi:hypothetical protein